MTFATPALAADLASTILGRPRGPFLPPGVLGPFLRRVRSRLDLLLGCRFSQQDRDDLLAEVLREIIERHGQLEFLRLDDFGILVNSLLARRAE